MNLIFRSCFGRKRGLRNKIFQKSKKTNYIFGMNDFPISFLRGGLHQRYFEAVIEKKRITRVKIGKKGVSLWG